MEVKLFNKAERNHIAAFIKKVLEEDFSAIQDSGEFVFDWKLD